MIRDHFRKRQLQQLSQIQVASPCTADWEAMEGDEKVRFYVECQRHVFNLSAMDVEEAGEKVAEHSGRLCVHFFRRADGMILTQDCPVGVERARQRRRLAIRTSIEVTVGLTLISAITGALVFPAFTTTGEVARHKTPGELAGPDIHTVPFPRPNPFAETGELKNVIDPWDFNAFSKHVAIGSRDLEHLRSLVEADQDVAAISSDGSTLLMTAANVGFLEAISFLLERGADRNAEDATGRTAFTVAMATGHYRAARLLQRTSRTEK